MTALRRVSMTPVAIVLAALILAASYLVGSFAGVRGDSHDETYYACLYAGSLSQVNTSGPPANCGRGQAISWGSAGGTIDGSQIELGSIPGTALHDGAVTHAKLNEDVQQDIRCGAFPRAYVDWHGCDLTYAHLAGANMLFGDLSSTSLGVANLDGANLQAVNLTDSYLNGASLIDAFLFGANLTNADLMNADLTNADLTNADLTNASLIDAVLTNATLTGVIWNNTICPDGTNSDNNGNTCVNNL